MVLDPFSSFTAAPFHLHHFIPDTYIWSGPFFLFLFFLPETLWSVCLILFVLHHWQLLNPKADFLTVVSANSPRWVGISEPACVAKLPFEGFWLVLCSTFNSAEIQHWRSEVSKKRGCGNIKIQMSSLKKIDFLNWKHIRLMSSESEQVTFQPLHWL